MRTGAKIAIGVGAVAAVAGLVWYVRIRKAKSTFTTGNEQPATNFNQQPTFLPVQIPGSGSPILTTAPQVNIPVNIPVAPQLVYATITEGRATMIKRNFVEENLQGLASLLR